MNILKGNNNDSEELESPSKLTEGTIYNTQGDKECLSPELKLKNVKL